MVRKKTSKASKVKKLTGKDLLSNASSYRSLLFGVITVVVLFLIGISVFQFLQNRQVGEIDGGAVSVSEIDEAFKNASAYIVKPSDTLWSIAQSELGSGFEWPKIADVNNIKTPEDLKEGVSLTIPLITSVSKESKTTAAISTSPGKNLQASNNSQIKTYVIKSGDTLWSIAEKVYKDGYRWVDIARVNNLTDPDLIHSDNVLKIPR